MSGTTFAPGPTPNTARAADGTILRCTCLRRRQSTTIWMSTYGRTSLGVILYELLTDTTPLENQQLKEAAYNEILRLIKDVEPPKPSTR